MRTTLLSVAQLLLLAGAAGFHAAHPALLPPQSRVGRPPVRLSAAIAATASAATPARGADRIRRGVLPALAASAVVLTPALAFASATGEHLHLGQKLALFFKGTGLPDWAILVLISTLPAVELRGGVPVGAWMGLNPLSTFIICVVGNMLPIAPTLLALRSDAVKKVAAPLLERANKKLAKLPSGQSRTLALALFVGIPAPGTGAWTGAIIAYLLGMPFGTAMGAILAGVLLAGAIMTILTMAGKAGALAALAALCAFGGGAILSAMRKEGTQTPSAKGDADAPAAE